MTGIDFGTRAALGDDTARMELTLLHEVYSRRDDKRYLRFVERNVPITAQQRVVYRSPPRPYARRTWGQLVPSAR